MHVQLWSLRFIFGLIALSYVICVLKGNIALHCSKYCDSYSIWLMVQNDLVCPPSAVSSSVCRMLEQSWDPFVQSWDPFLAEALVLLVLDLIISLSGTAACNNHLYFLTWFVVHISRTTCWILAGFREQDSCLVTRGFFTDINIFLSLFSLHEFRNTY